MLAGSSGGMGPYDGSSVGAGGASGQWMYPQAQAPRQQRQQQQQQQRQQRAQDMGGGSGSLYLPGMGRAGGAATAGGSFSPMPMGPYLGGTASGHWLVGHLVVAPSVGLNLSQCCTRLVLQRECRRVLLARYLVQLPV